METTSQRPTSHQAHSSSIAWTQSPWHSLLASGHYVLICIILGNLVSMDKMRVLDVSKNSLLVGEGLLKGNAWYTPVASNKPTTSKPLTKWEGNLQCGQLVRMTTMASSPMLILLATLAAGKAWNCLKCSDKGRDHATSSFTAQYHL